MFIRGMGMHRGIPRIHRTQLPGTLVVARGLPAARRKTGVKAVVCLGDATDATGDGTRIHPRSVVRRMGTIVGFAIPVLLVPIADPLMSLIDVIFLGQFSTSLNVAGLSPATLIFNFLFCTVYYHYYSHIHLLISPFSHPWVARSLGCRQFHGANHCHRGDRGGQTPARQGRRGRTGPQHVTHARPGWRGHGWTPPTA